jgi:hypothetical protein
VDDFGRDCPIVLLTEHQQTLIVDTLHPADSPRGLLDHHADGCRIETR